MQLSIIIVNYNVKHFLEQCLYSVLRASRELTCEVIVVDNNSSDESLSFLQPAFPGVRFLVNNENVGFAKACNQGWKISKGEYVLFLNPDTLVPEDCFAKCLEYLSQHPEAGALGVRMTDGQGKFLRESKRAFPSPITSLFKLFGLSQLFPKSPTFSRYHLGHLDEHKDHEVDVLAGAFMMLKRDVLEQTGGFDERFFMYGEDIDLSYRVQQLGKKNIYFAQTSIIHFKGESTKKQSVNYVRMFYAAMSQFVRKHYGGSKAGVFNASIHVAIWLRAAMTTTASFTRRFGVPLIDAALILISFWLMKSIWNEYVKTDTRYENRLLWFAFPVFTLVYMITAYYAGLYDRWYRRHELLQSTVAASLVLLASYSLLPEQYRFSRGIILFGSVLAFVFISLIRWLLVKWNVIEYRKRIEEHANTLVAASEQEQKRVVELLTDVGRKEKVLGRLSLQKDDVGTLGYWKEAHVLQEKIPFREIIFCTGSLPVSAIIDYLPMLKNTTRIRFHAEGSKSIVGSDSKNSAGESLSAELLFRLSDPRNRRLKRLIDIAVSLTGLLAFPIALFLVRKPFSFFGNCFTVLFAQKTWIGYAVPGKNLPQLRPAVLACNGIPVTTGHPLPLESLQMLDYWYARDYEPLQDLRLIGKQIKRLGGH